MSLLFDFVRDDKDEIVASDSKANRLKDVCICWPVSKATQRVAAEESQKDERKTATKISPAVVRYAPVAARRLGPFGVVWDACVASLPSYAGVAPGNRWG